MFGCVYPGGQLVSIFKGVLKLKIPTKKKILFVILLDIILIAVLISCISGNTQKNPGQDISPAPEATPAPTEAIQGAPDNVLPPTEQAAGTEQQDQKQPAGNPNETTSSTGADAPKAPDPGTATDVSESGGGAAANNGLPYFREENAERYTAYQKENPDMPFEKVVVYVNIGLDRKFYEGIRPAVNTDSLNMLVNKYNQLPDDFKPELTKLPDSLCVPGVGEQYLRKEAMEALLKLQEDAKKEGLNIRAYGTYRSIATQKSIWNNAVNSGRTVEDVDSLNARGGHSEHHTGLAVDVIINNYSILDTPEYKWYKDKIHQYGFIIRYPEGMEHITGYKFEPWHFRYLGPELATAVYVSGLTYEEYYAMYLEAQ